MGNNLEVGLERGLEKAGQQFGKEIYGNNSTKEFLKH